MGKSCGIRNVLFMAALTIVVLVAPICFGYEDEGFQWWTTTSATVDLNDNWKCVFDQEFRLGDDGGNLYYEHSDLGLVYSGLADWIDLGANFRLIYEKDSSDHFQRENMPHLNVTFKANLFDCQLSTRSRFEFRDRTNKDDVWRYRNKFAVKLPFELTVLKFKPYLSEEIFVTMNDDNIGKSRLAFGATFPLSKKVDADVFYMWQATRSGGEWLDINVLGTGLKFKF